LWQRVSAREDGELEPIVVASSGRAGSSLLAGAIVDGVAAHRRTKKRRVYSEAAFEPTGVKFRSGIVYKTHALPKEFPIDRPIKFVFVFGRPSDTVVSLLAARIRQGRQWMEDHFRHMRGRGHPDDLVEKDVFGIGHQIEQWSNAEQFDVLCIKYEGLWRHAGEIASFLHVPFEMPPFRARSSPTEVPQDLIARARRNYGELDAAYEALDELLAVRGRERRPVSAAAP
jgi:hypothetical protein